MNDCTLEDSSLPFVVYFVSVYSAASCVTESNARFTDAGTLFDTRGA